MTERQRTSVVEWMTNPNPDRPLFSFSLSTKDIALTLL